VTPPDSPSALLERAAALIEQRAAAAEARPEGPQMQAYAAWWVWLSPFINAPNDVAQPLVEWLRTAAFEFEEATGPAEAAGEPVESYVGSASRAALTFARQVLGES
jgi:hypothetical protein